MTATLTPLPKSPRPVLRTAAHERFMSELYAGAIRPGEFVSQNELCELLSVPLGPMREALKRLEAEAIVALIPQRGIKILTVDDKTVSDAFQMRLLFELEAVRAFAASGDRHQARELREKTAAAGDAIDPSEAPNRAMMETLTDLDHGMHRLFVEALKNPFATDLLGQLLSRLRIARLTVRLPARAWCDMTREHVRILDLAVSGKAKKSAAAMETHLENARGRALGG
ncbi:MAG: GntR family transcriptional regulator [Pseudomonadota bacterium]